MTDSSLDVFLKEAGIDLTSLSDSVSLPDVNLEALLNPQSDLVQIDTSRSPPKLAWVLIGIPLVRFDEISPDIEKIGCIPGIIMEMTQNDVARRKNR